MDLPIILIGPMEAGKTTIAGLLAQKLNLVHYELDEKRWDYYQEIGYDEALAEKIRAEEGFPGVYRYWKPFEIHAVERVLTDCEDGVISFGAGHSVYEDAQLFERAQLALQPFANVILLLPSRDTDESVEILKKRFREHLKAEGMDASPQSLEMIEHFIRHPSNRRLAKRVVYTIGQTPQQTCDGILQLLSE
jgi:shikimate kinase